MTSMRNESSLNYYEVGGTLSLNAPSYVEREADEQLYNKILKEGVVCSVLTSRQMGKSSLIVQVRHRLEKENFICVVIDLQAIGNARTREQWYKTFAKHLLKDFFCNNNWDSWWNEHDTGLTTISRLDTLVEEIILTSIPATSKVVIFIDEIDYIHALGSREDRFTDDLFIWIRARHNKRSNNANYNRLKFCLLGVVTPSDLIQNKTVTSFNIGQVIALKGFTASEVGPLIKGLEEKVDDPSKVMAQVLFWTGGQPFLTQLLCDLIVNDCERITIREEEKLVEEIVRSRIINFWENDNVKTHFDTIEARILKSDNQKSAISLLKIYKEILNKGKIRIIKNSGQEELKLSGLVISKEGHLQPFNRIYKEVFNLEWINDKLAELIPYKDQFDSWCNAKEEIKERYLLYGKDLEDALQWAEDKTLGKIDRLFLDASRDFQKNIEANFPEGDYQSFGYAMLIWTGGVKSLNQFIFSHISTQHKSIVNPKLIKTVVDLEQWFDTKFKLFDKLKKFKKDESIRNEFEEIIHDLLNTSECNSISLLLKYEEILEKEEVNFDENSLEHQTLINMCLVILDKDNKLRILNKIYEKLLNQDWIKELIVKLRPDAKAFWDWKSSAQSNSHLLHNNDLRLALERLGKKPTPTLDVSEIEFVMTSLVAEVWRTDSHTVKSEEAKAEATKSITDFRRLLHGKNNYSDFLLQGILQWTRPEPLLLNELLEVVNKTEISTTNYHDWIEQLVKTQIINNWQHCKLAEHFQLIEQGLTNNQSCESFWLIVKYRQILLQGKIEIDETRESTKLIELGLVVKIDQQLEIANPIYENIFDKRWTYQKLSEYKRIRAINLLKWYPANIPEQNDTALHSDLGEWMDNNLPILSEIIPETQCEVFDNEFNFIDEIKLLTYDIIEANASDNTQISIQHSLNRIFKDDIKKMAQNTLDILLNETVENATEIEAIVILGLKAGMVSGKNSNLESNNSSLYQIVRSETFVSFAKLKTIPDILDNFGEKTNFGKLSYVMFTLEKGVVISHFTKIQGSPFAICFISNSEVDMPGLFLAQCEGKFEKIQKELEKVLG
jgi:hypothetical protein